MDLAARERDRIWYCIATAMSRAALNGRDNLTFREIMASDPQFAWSTSTAEDDKARILGLASPSVSPSVSPLTAPTQTSAEQVKRELAAKHPTVKIVEVRG
jgi:hypothetical protein